MNPPSGEVGYLQVPVLPYLIGQPFDEQVMSLASTLRPSRIAAIRPGDHVDPYLWQVIITVGPGDRVVSIEQQVEIKLPSDYIEETSNGQIHWTFSAPMIAAWGMEKYHTYLKPLVDVECVDDPVFNATLEQELSSEWER